MSVSLTQVKTKQQRVIFVYEVANTQQSAGSTSDLETNRVRYTVLSLFAQHSIVIRLRTIH